MDFQPPNVFVRDCETYGDTIILRGPLRCFHYFLRRAKTWVPGPRDPQTWDLRRPLWVTPWEYYEPQQARLALALPGPVPTHRLTLILPPGTVLYGPAWVAPLARARVLVDPNVGRPGNGTEYLVTGKFPIRFDQDRYNVEEL